MNPQNQAQPPAAPGQPQVKNPLSVMQPGEQIVCEIKRHPIGMIGIYVGAGFLLVLLAVIAFVVIPNAVTGNGHNGATAIGALLFAITALLSLGFVFVSNKVYWGNSWVVTSDSVTQIRQTSLFDRQSSQLSLGNLEDVSAVQNGILAHMFNYGLIRVETAGERSKFIFTYCPNPNRYAQEILNAREQFEQRRQDGQRPFRGEGSYPTPENPGDGQIDNGVNINTES